MNANQFVDKIGGIKSLQDTAEPLQKAVRSILPGEVKDLLHGKWLGHPLHPALTDIPIGAWTAALALDALESLSGAEQCGRAADVAIGVGLAGAVGAAVTGLTDWSETDERARSIGLVHGLLNIVATSLYTTSWIMRKRRRSRQSGIALSMLGYATALASAYLGGHLVYSEQVGVDHTATADQKKPETFKRAMKTENLKEDQPTRAEVDGVAVLLVKHGEQIHALTETCPHLGGPLSEGKIVGDAIQCPWHGSRLALDTGRVLNGPTTYPARCFDVRVRAGYIEVRAASRD